MMTSLNQITLHSKTALAKVTRPDLVVAELAVEVAEDVVTITDVANVQTEEIVAVIVAVAAAAVAFQEAPTLTANLTTRDQKVSFKEIETTTLTQCSALQVGSYAKRSILLDREVAEEAVTNLEAIVVEAVSYTHLIRAGYSACFSHWWSSTLQ